MHAPDFILLVRHGSKVNDAWRADSQLELSEEGRQGVVDSAGGLASEILTPTSGESPINICEIWYATSIHAMRTATIFRDVLRNRGVPTGVLRDHVELDPKRFWSVPVEQPHELIAEDLRTCDRCQESSNAILVAGHSPQLEWIAEALTGVPVAIAHSELVCIRLTGRGIRLRTSWPHLRRSHGYVLWTIAPTDKDTKEQILAKIRSKMETAKLLGALMATVLGWILGSFLDPDKLAALRWQNPWAYPCLGLSALCFFVAILLYLATMYAYDSLLMPKAFWSSKQGAKTPRWLPRRPPSSDLRVLYHNMMHVWYWRFTPATVLVVLGLLLLAGAFIRPTLTVWCVVLITAAILLIVNFLGRPRHGAQD